MAKSVEELQTMALQKAGEILGEGLTMAEACFVACTVWEVIRLRAADIFLGIKVEKKDEPLKQ